VGEPQERVGRPGTYCERAESRSVRAKLHARQWWGRSVGVGFMCQSEGHLLKVRDLLRLQCKAVSFVPQPCPPLPSRHAEARPPKGGFPP
jgi:hypothetical protein